VPVFKPALTETYKKAIILLHGLNEKHWDKYLAWALKLLEETGSPVILFPIAFHMNRAPEIWASPKDMMKIARERKGSAERVSQSSFANAALSQRIHSAPQRFFSSGMQSFYDIIQFIEGVKSCNYIFLDKACRFDIFGYSIGASLGEVLVTSNYKNYFNDSKLFMFCGGAVLDNASPVSKTIIDSAAYNELFRWLNGLFDTVTTAGKRAKEIFFQDIPEVMNFKSFLFYDKFRSVREAVLKKSSDRIRELSLLKDRVFTPASTSRTLNGFAGDIMIKTETMDFPFTYRHENPFPLDQSCRYEINNSFEEVFSRAASFFKC
jgi:hypothetical protein